jgi:hypothetical protein
MSEVETNLSVVFFVGLNACTIFLVAVGNAFSLKNPRLLNNFFPVT